MPASAGSDPPATTTTETSARADRASGNGHLRQCTRVRTAPTGIDVDIPSQIGQVRSSRVTRTPRSGPEVTRPGPPGGGTRGGRSDREADPAGQAQPADARTTRDGTAYGSGSGRPPSA
ncbi:hypothetical protein Cpa01nite_20030 [Cellulomonas pakistanensis]|uniref:Uncharacterized protein n=1 Tax=Cellulomonas pakistanensis TaxID=992287 RepID=A0A919PDJ1_9CELL|nr:hypothetical protein Cpa01nite_20030 [Cellulomonas pakistanensis]